MLGALVNFRFDFVPYVNIVLLIIALVYHTRESLSFLKLILYVVNMGVLTNIFVLTLICTCFQETHDRTLYGVDYVDVSFIYFLHDVTVIFI